MARPKFTPDPPPYGVDIDPALETWIQEQLNRISDWWPKDFESRIEALELRSTSKAGTAPINTRARFYLEGNLGGISSKVAVEEYAAVINGGLYISTTDYSGFATAVTYGTTAPVRHIVTNDEGVLAGCGPQGKVSYSLGGEPWSEINPGFSTGMHTMGVVYYDGLWYAAGGHPSAGADGLRIMSTTDFVTWNEVYVADNGDTYGIFRSDGAGNFLLYHSSGGTTEILHSNNKCASWSGSATTWTTTPSISRNMFFHNGRWFGLGGKNAIFTSDNNGSTWTLRHSSGASSDYQVAIATDGTRFVTVGGTNDPMLTSIDNGVNWSTVHSTWTTSLHDSLTYHADRGWLYGSAGSVQSSSDGLSWSAVSHPGGGSWSGVDGVYNLERPL